MGKHKHTSNLDHAIIGEDKRKFRPIKVHVKSNKQIAISIVVVAVISGVILGAVWFGGRSQESKPSTDTATESEYTPAQQARSSEGAGDLDTAEKSYDSWVDAASTDEEKYEAYTNRALFYLNQYGSDTARLQQGVEDAERAYRLQGTFSAAAITAVLHENAGNAAKAIEYYTYAKEKLQTLIDGGEYDGGNTVQEYQTAIERLQNE